MTDIDGAKVIHSLGKLEGKLDTLIEAHKEHRRDDQAFHTQLQSEHEVLRVRVTSVERKQSWAMGVVAAVAAIGGAVAGWFKYGGSV